MVPLTLVGGAGGGGGGGGGTVETKVNFSGRAYPRSTITLLKDAQVAATTVADATANFSVSLSNLSPTAHREAETAKAHRG